MRIDGAHRAAAATLNATWRVSAEGNGRAGRHARVSVCSHFTPVARPDVTAVGRGHTAGMHAMFWSLYVFEALSQRPTALAADVCT